MKMRIKVLNAFLSLEEHSVFYSNEKQLMCTYFCLTTWFYKFYHTSAQMGISWCKMCPGRIVKNKFSKLTADTSS